MSEINIGDTARDSITGFEGVVIGFTDYLHNCRRPILQPKTLKDGKPIDNRSFDLPSVELVARGDGSYQPPPPRPFGLGDVVRDKVTGFEGVLVSRTEWSNGCDRYSVQSTQMHEGKPIDAEGFDGIALELVKSASPKPAAVKAGGPRPEPKRR